MLDTSIHIKTESFDGPLALLLMLIQKEQMSIRDLDLTLITKQYLTYLQEMREVNFNVAGDYLYLAATLLFLKSKECITEEEQKHLDEEDNKALNILSQAELVKRLEELQNFQRLGQKIWGLNKRGHEIFVKPKVDRKAIVNSILTPMDLEKLTSTMMDLIVRGKRKYKAVRKDKISIKDKLSTLKDNLNLGEKYTFSNLVKDHGGDNIDNIVISFISVLELARLRQVSIFQTNNGSDIYIKVINSFEDFDVNFAKGHIDDEDENRDPVSELDLMITATEANEIENLEVLQ